MLSSLQRADKCDTRNSVTKIGDGTSMVLQWATKRDNWNSVTKIGELDSVIAAV